ILSNKGVKVAQNKKLTTFAILRRIDGDSFDSLVQSQPMGKIGRATPAQRTP
ncbi:hypothetical protein POREN0001_0134, partial [Porphyromonas endodontalis ATCC 35406]